MNQKLQKMAEGNSEYVVQWNYDENEKYVFYVFLKKQQLFGQSNTYT